MNPYLYFTMRGLECKLVLLRDFSFLELWVSLIMECETTISNPISINGIPLQASWPGSSLRQGDLLSLYLSFCAWRFYMACWL